jgi:hypothetical protein
MNWISVDNKPPEGVNLFIAYKSSFGGFAGYTTAMWVNGGFYSGGNYPITRSVTHWMLPEPPEDV